MRQSVVIIGAGALGKCLAALLAERFCVTVYERDRSALQKLQKHGFRFKEGNRVRHVRVNTVASLKALWSEKIDVLIFATKVMDLSKAVRASAQLNPQCVFLPQNGLVDIAWVQRVFKNAAVCRGVTTMACLEHPTGQAELFYRGHVFAGGAGASKVAAFLRRANIKVSVYQDPQRAVFAKLIFNAVMNPLPILTGQGYVILNKDRRTYLLVKNAVEEGMAVARVRGIRLAFDPMKLIKRVKDGDLSGLSYKGSMFDDISNGRATEIDFITGALIRAARKSGVAVPVLKSILAKAKAAGA